MVKGRFGSAIASVGDLDGDGNEDLVVGSPYENDGQGAVRVFYGNNNLILIFHVFLPCNTCVICINVILNCL